MLRHAKHPSTYGVDVSADGTDRHERPRHLHVGTVLPLLVHRVVGLGAAQVFRLLLGVGQGTFTAYCIDDAAGRRRANSSAGNLKRRLKKNKCHTMIANITDALVKT